MMMLVGLMAVPLVAVTVSASPMSDIPEGLNDALFDGANIYASRMILAGAVILAAVLSMAVAKLNPVGIIFMLLILIGILTAIGWLDYWVLVFAAIIVALIFAQMVAGLFDKPGGPKS